MNSNTRIDHMRCLLTPNSGHYIVRSRNDTPNPFNCKRLAEVEDQIDAGQEDTINTLEIILCRKIGNTRVTEKNVGFPLKFRNESKNNLTMDQANQTLVQFDDYNTKITRYLGHKNLSQMDDDIGLSLYLPNAETENDIIFFKFKTNVDIELISKMKWVVYPSEPLITRVFLRIKMFNNDELFRNVPCVEQLFRGRRTSNVDPIPFPRIVPVREAEKFHVI